MVPSYLVAALCCPLVGRELEGRLVHVQSARLAVVPVVVRVAHAVDAVLHGMRREEMGDGTDRGGDQAAACDFSLGPHASRC